MVTCLPSLLEALGLIPDSHKLDVVVTICTPRRGRWRQESQEFYVIFSSTVSSQPTGATQTLGGWRDC